MNDYCKGLMTVFIPLIIFMIGLSLCVKFNKKELLIDFVDVNTETGYEQK